MEGFFEYNEITTKPWMKNAWNASIATHFIGEEGHSSGIFISSNGYMLTALHTIRWLLKKNGIMRNEAVSHDELLKSTVLDQAPSEHYLDALEVRDFDLTRPKVIFLGQGLHVLRGVGIRDMPEDKIVEASNFHQDFAILKFETNHALPFVPLTSSEVLGQEDVFHISTPLKATRANSKHSNGHTKYITYGKTGNLADSECLASDEEIRRRTKLFYDKAHQFCSADHAVGSSGGPFFNSVGDLLGISTIGLYASDKEYRSLGTGFLKSSFILSQLTSDIKNKIFAS